MSGSKTRRTNLTVQEIKALLEQRRLSREEIRRLAQDDRAGVRQAIQHWRRQQAEQMWERRRLYRLYNFERQYYARGWWRIAGVDEAGRGPLAGPLVVGAVVLPPECFITGLNDSKKLSEDERERLYEIITRVATAVSVYVVDVPTIEQLNIYHATVYGMEQAIHSLPVAPQALLVDAMVLPRVNLPQQALVKGDNRSASIAAASIVAKVTRDRIMREYDKQFPQYGFASHKGYCTAAHLAALARYGPCHIHRRTFAPVRKLLAGEIDADR